ncbi:MAG: glycosyltransferase family 4 protein [Armatimonadetes bacterium]|nr:glycosyltransferase family 4 protein [Armatimonadota bacterium]
MRVLIANKFYRPVGGPETIVFDTARELEALGHEAITFAMAHPDNRESQYSDYFVPSIDYNTRQSKGIKRLAKEAADIVYSREARERIERLIADTRPDIAHLHNIYHQLSPSILAALKKAGIPTVLTLHDAKLICPAMLLLTHGRVCERCRGKWFHHAVLRKCVKDSYASSLVCAVEGAVHRSLRLYERNVDLFVTPSRFLKGRMVQYGRLPEDRVEVLHNYADTRSIAPDFAPGEYGLFIGRIEALKGVLTLLEACGRVGGFEVRFAGKGPLLEECQRIVSDEHIENARFLGFQTGADFRRQLAESRFVVLPSECHENCPMVILEAFSAGKPVIASNMGGIPELVEHGADGLIFEAGNADELASCMRRLIDDPAMASEMGRRGRAKVEERFSIEKYMESLLAIYERLLGRGRGDA